MAQLADPFRLLADEARLRILRVLLRERLTISELVRVVGIAQSGVSRHVRLLREAGFVREERRGSWTLLDAGETAPASLGEAWPALRAWIGASAAGADGDEARLSEVLREREERGEEPRASVPAEPGRSWSAWARALGHLLPPLRVAHLGCGEGALTLEVARWARAVVGVDADAAALAKARAAARRAGVRHATWRRGRPEATALPEASFDVVLLSQALHAAEDPSALVREAARLVRPGGRVLVLDLLPHGEEWVRDRLGHRRLGVSAEEVGAWFAAAGLERARTETAARRRGNPFRVLVASATRPEARRRTR